MSARSSEGPPHVGAMVEEVVGCKWAMRLLELVTEGPRRPSELQRRTAGLSTKVMNERLRKLQRLGVLERRVSGARPPLRVEYALTPFGRRFARVIDEVRALQSALEREAASPTRREA